MSVAIGPPNFGTGNTGNHQSIVIVYVNTSFNWLFVSASHIHDDSIFRLFFRQVRVCADQSGPENRFSEARVDLIFFCPIREPKNRQERARPFDLIWLGMSDRRRGPAECVTRASMRSDQRTGSLKRE